MCPYMAAVQNCTTRGHKRVFILQCFGANAAVSVALLGNSNEKQSVLRAQPMVNSSNGPLCPTESSILQGVISLLFLLFIHQLKWLWHSMPYIFEASVKGLKLLPGELRLGLQLVEALRLMPHHGEFEVTVSDVCRRETQQKEWGRRGTTGNKA